ncbi:MAG: sel1 repeat family protein [Pseudomonadota bacterium]
MRSRTRSELLAGTFAIASFCLPLNALAQIWPVRAMLDKVSSPYIQLRDKNGGTESVSRAWVQRVADVSERIAPIYGLPVPGLYIEKQGGPNAYVTRGKNGIVMVMSIDMLKLVGHDDDLMASVIGHELGHVKAEHLTKGRDAQTAISLIGTFAGLLLDLDQAKKGVNTQGLGQQLGAAGSGLVNAKYSRDQEREADDLGIKNMAAAGFNPEAPARMWQLMAAQTAGGSGVWMSSHPSHAERYQTLQAMASSLAPVYAAAKPSRSPGSPPVTAVALAQYKDPYPAATYKSFEPTDAEKTLETPNAYRRGMTAHREKRFEEAYAAFQEAAASGDGRALCILGDYAQQGRAQPIDLVKAKELYEASANKGLSYAIYSLGQMALEGKGGQKDTAEAARLLTIAHNRNVPRASAFLGAMYSRGDYVEKNVATARQLMETSAEAGDVIGKAFFAVALRDGIGGPSDQPRAISLLKTAAETNYPFAAYQMGVSYERGIGVTADKDKAIASYRQATAGGNTAAAQRLKALGQ